MLHDIIRDATASFNARDRINKVFDIVKYGSSNIFHIDNIVSDVLMYRLNGVSGNVLYTPIPDYYDKDTSVVLINSKPIDLIDGIVITEIEDMMYIHHPTMMLDNIQSIVFMIGKGDNAVTKGVGHGELPICDAEETVICIDKDGRILEYSESSDYVYMHLKYESIVIQTSGPYHDSIHCLSDMGIHVNESGVFDVANQIDVINDYMIQNNHVNGKVILFCDRYTDSYFRKTYEYMSENISNYNAHRFTNDDYINRLITLVKTDAEILDEMNNIKSHDFGLYHRLLYEKSSLISDINYKISELNTTASIDYDDHIWDAVREATPKVIIPVYNPNGGSVEVFFNNKLVTDFFHIPGGTGWDTVFVGVDKLYSDIAIRNYDKDRLGKWFDELTTKDIDMINVSIRRKDFHTYAASFTEVNNGYMIIPDGWNGWYDKRVYLNGIWMDDSKYNVEVALDGTLILFPRYITRPGDVIQITYYDEPIVYTSTDLSTSNHIEIPFGMSDELWLHGVRLNKHNYEVLSSNDVMIYTDISQCIGNDCIKHIRYIDNDYAGLKTSDYNYNILRAEQDTFGSILNNPINVNRRSAITPLSEEWSDYVFDVHMFYTLYGSQHEVVNMDNEMPARAEEIISAHTDEFDRLMYNANEDIFPRDMTIPGGQLAFLDAFHILLDRLYESGITTLDANINIYDTLTEDEKLMFGDVIPTVTEIYLREKNTMPIT